MLAHRPATAQRSPTHRAVSFSYGHPPLFDERAEPAGFFSPAANSGSPSVAAAADSGGAAASSSFNPSGLKCVNTLSGHHSGILSITVGHGRVYTGSYDNTIKVRRSPTARTGLGQRAGDGATEPESRVVARAARRHACSRRVTPEVASAGLARGGATLGRRLCVDPRVHSECKASAHRASASES